MIVNGDVKSAADAVRALAETGCAGVMIGRAAIDHPWIFREATALLAGRTIAPPTDAERLAMYAAIVTGNVARRGVPGGLGVSRRYLGVLGPLAATLRRPLCQATTLEATLELAS